MGILRKRNRNRNRNNEVEKTKSGQRIENLDYKDRLDLIQKEVHQFLKPLGFKKRGRTFNRETEAGLFQVINFQSGQYPIGDNYEIPNIRESLYGKFTVNLGVCIEELYLIESPRKSQRFYQDYDCQIRCRLATLIKGIDIWWDLSSDLTLTTKEIIEGLELKGFGWFKIFDTREKIINNWDDHTGTDSPNIDSPIRAKLDLALLIWQTDKKKGATLIQDYYDNIGNEKKSHKQYVIDLAKKLKVTINE